MIPYITNHFFVQHAPKDMGVRTHREIRTWAECIDALQDGDLAHCGDLMMQRLKALCQSVTDGSWATARHHELIPPGEVTLVPQEEVEMVARAEARAAKLRGYLEQAKSRLRGGQANH